MATFITLWNWTPQGLNKIEDTVQRAESFATAAGKAGLKVKDFYWTVGEYDGCIVIEAPDEITAIASVAKLARLGNIRTRTLRALNTAEMRQVLEKMK